MNRFSFKRTSYLDGVLLHIKPIYENLYSICFALFLCFISYLLTKEINASFLLDIYAKRNKKTKRTVFDLTEKTLI